MLFTPAFLIIICFITTITLITGVYMVERGISRVHAALAAKSVKSAPLRLQ